MNGQKEVLPKAIEELQATNRSLDTEAGMVVVHSGKVRLFTTAPGREIMLALLGRGDFFGEMSLADASPRNATAVAEEDDTRLIISNREKFLYLIGQQPAFILWSCHLDIQLCFSYI